VIEDGSHFVHSETSLSEGLIVVWDSSW